jgi:TPR repeat protein
VDVRTIRALCFAGEIVRDVDEVRRAAGFGDAYAQAGMAVRAIEEYEESFRWAEKSAAQGERDAFDNLGFCYQYGIGCEKDLERAKENYLVAAELGLVRAMVSAG